MWHPHKACHIQSTKIDYDIWQTNFSLLFNPNTNQFRFLISFFLKSMLNFMDVQSFKTPGLSFFYLIPGGYQGKKERKKWNPWLWVWEQAGSGAFPYTFRGQNEKGRKRAKTIGKVDLHIRAFSLSPLHFYELILNKN